MLLKENVYSEYSFVECQIKGSGTDYLGSKEPQFYFWQLIKIQSLSGADELNLI